MRVILPNSALLRQPAIPKFEYYAIAYFYVEGIIKHPDIKLIAIDGVAPTVENIQNGTYPVIAPVYAVTWAGNDNPNVKKLLDWILSDEGQYIIEESGYVGIKK